MANLHEHRVRMRAFLEEGWDGLSDRLELPPAWLDRLALQLELWVGDEFEESPYLEIGYDDPSDELRRANVGRDFAPNALNSEALYLIAFTDSYFVHVEVQKDSGSREVTNVDVRVVPRDRLTALAAREMTTRGPEADGIQLHVSYADDGDFVIPREVVHAHKTWHSDGGVSLFRKLREDLWRPVGTDSTADVQI